MPFKSGNDGGPGRPKGSMGGRTLCLQTLDAMLAEEGNQKALREALQKEFSTDPIKFMRQFVLALMPRDVKLQADVMTRILKVIEVGPDDAKRLFAADDKAEAGV